MSQNLDTYVTFKASLSLQIRTYIWNLLLQVSTVLIMIVVKTGRCFKKNKNQNPDVIPIPAIYIQSSCLEQKVKNSQISPSKQLFQTRHQPSDFEIISL